MKLTFLAENLQKKLPLVTHGVSNRSQLQILSHVLLEATEEKLIIKATDLEIGMEIGIPAQVEEKGVITVPAKTFLELVQTLPTDKITLQTKEGTLEITSKRTRSVIQTTPAEEFPSLYEELGTNVITFEPGEMKKIFNRVVFSSSAEGTRPALSGVLLKKEENGYTIVATDGYRLSLDHFVSKGEMGSLIIPSRVIREATGLSESGELGLFVSVPNNQIAFTQSGTVLVGRLIEAEFPNYQKIIPNEFSTKVSFERESLQKAVKACGIFARETANIIKFSMQREKIVVSAKTPSLGENTVEVEAQLVGEENDIAFNSRYILDFLANVGEEQLIFEMSGPLNAGVFRIANNTSFLHLIMPIRTQE